VPDEVGRGNIPPAFQAPKLPSVRYGYSKPIDHASHWGCDHAWETYLRKLAIVLFLVGAAMLANSLMMSPFKDAEAFDERTAKLAPSSLFFSGDQRYWQRMAYRKHYAEMRTPKYQLQDYSISLIGLSCLILAATRGGTRGLTTPTEYETPILLAFFLPFITVICEMLDLYQRYYRREFPPWVELRDISMMNTPFLLGILLLISLPHLMFLRAGFHPRVPLTKIISFKTNWWLLLVLGVTSYFILMDLLYCNVLDALSGCFWIYFFLSLGTAPHGEHSLHDPASDDIPDQVSE
jgi:hypothetical protein